MAAITVYAEASQNDAMSQYFGYQYGGQGDGSGDLVAYSQGSGVVLTEDGYIITNNHVVEGGSAYEVMVAGETYEADLVGTDPSSDVAVLKAKDASGLTVMELGDSDNLTIGEWVMTLAAPSAWSSRWPRASYLPRAAPRLWTPRNRCSPAARGRLPFTRT